MNTIINIALIFWTGMLSALFFYLCASCSADKEAPAAFVAGLISFLALLTAVLAIGQYIN